MKIAAWIALGVVLGLALNASAQQYTFYYYAEEIESKSAETQRAYVAGVFDALESVVKGNNTYHIIYTPQNLSKSYLCMQGIARDTAGLVNWTRMWWTQNPKGQAADVMIEAGVVCFK